MNRQFKQYHLSENASIVSSSLPGPKSGALLEEQKRREGSIVSYPHHIPVAFEKGLGAVLEDADGNRYLDFYAGAGVLNLGRRNPDILDAVKAKETDGYAYDSAQASFELLARGELGLAPDFFDVERYRVISERRRNAKGEIVVESESVVTISTRDGPRTSFFKNEHAQDMQDDGPVNALWQALKSDLGPYQAAIEDMRLTDFKVRITQGGTEAVTRVIIDFADDEGRAWATVGVSANIVDASFEALVDAINWKLVQGAKGSAEAAE